MLRERAPAAGRRSAPVPHYSQLCHNSGTKFRVYLLSVGLAAKREISRPLVELRYRTHDVIGVPYSCGDSARHSPDPEHSLKRLFTLRACGAVLSNPEPRCSSQCAVAGTYWLPQRRLVLLLSHVSHMPRNHAKPFTTQVSSYILQSSSLRLQRASPETESNWSVPTPNCSSSSVIAHDPAATSHVVKASAFATAVVPSQQASS